MQAVRRFLSAIGLSLISITLVLGGLSLALAESYTPLLATPTAFNSPFPLTATPTLPAALLSATPLVSPTSSQTPLPPPFCPPPPGWISMMVLPGDTLASIAARYQTTPQELGQANCLLTESLIPGSTLFVPPLPTLTPIPCGPPPGWIYGYIVQAGDTLYHIAQQFYTTPSALQQANCKGNSTYLRVGERLWVPNVATRTPGVTLIPDFSTPTPSEIPTTEALTETPVPATSTPLPSETPLPTNTLVPTLTASPTAFPTNTP
jgi:LysM repeat protein